MDTTSNGEPQPPLVQTKEAPDLYDLFFGPEGLRAGWRFAIYVAAVVGLSVLVIPLINGPLLPKSKGLPPLWVFLVFECESFVAAVVPALALSRLEKRPFSAYGLPPQGAFGKNFWAGVIWGFVAITCLLLVLRATGVFYFGGFALHGSRVLKFAAFWGVLFFMVGLFEDFAFRGYSQFTLAQGIGFWPAAVVLSVIFGAIHLPQELALGDHPRAWIGIIGAALIGLFFCLTLRRTGSLWFAIGMHASWDWGQTFVYSVPDSGTVAPGHLLSSSFRGNPWLTGGPIGPEASVFLFLVIAVLWLVFHRVYPAKKEVAPVGDDVLSAQSRTSG